MRSCGVQSNKLYTDIGNVRTAATLYQIQQPSFPSLVFPFGMFLDFVAWCIIDGSGLSMDGCYALTTDVRGASEK